MLEHWRLQYISSDFQIRHKEESEVLVENDFQFHGTVNICSLELGLRTVYETIITFVMTITF